MRVRLGAQVVEYVRSLAPEPRKVVNAALRDLYRGRGDVRPLEGPLQEYWRLRVGSYRIILRYRGERTVECVYAERRSLIYEVFSETLIERLIGK